MRDPLGRDRFFGRGVNFNAVAGGEEKRLGAARRFAEDAIDFGVGFSEIKKVGEKVEAREPMLFIHARDDRGLAAVLPLLEKGITIE